MEIEGLVSPVGLARCPRRRQVAALSKIEQKVAGFAFDLTIYLRKSLRDAIYCALHVYRIYALKLLYAFEISVASLPEL
jgi:hypothetical protein